MATPLPSMQQQSAGTAAVGGAVDKQQGSAGGGSHHHRHHAIARVASAHGPRDSILSFQHYHHRQQQQQQQAPSQQQQQQYHRHQSPSPLVTNSSGARLVGGSAPPALCPGVIGQTPTIAIPPPPHYEQAMAAAVAASVASNEENQGPGSVLGNSAKFSNRRSPESRTPIQAVLPMQPSLAREVIPSPTSIPDECQVVKQLVREMAAGQLSVMGNLGSAYSSDGGAVVSQPLATAHAAPPPPYHQQQFQGQPPLQPVRQQQIPSQHQKPLAALHQQFGAASSAHPLLSGTTNPPGFSTTMNASYVVNSPSSKEASGAGHRLSLSHPDLSRLQSLQFSACHAPANVDELASAYSVGAANVLHSANAINAMAASFASASGSSQPSLGRAQQRPLLQHQQQQLAQFQLQQPQQMSGNMAAAQQGLAGKLAEHGAAYAASFSGSMVGAAAAGNRVAYLPSHQPPAGVPAPAYQYEAVRQLDTSPFVQANSSNALAAGVNAQASASRGTPGPLAPTHDFGHRCSVDSYEADLETNAFTRMMNLLKEENKKLRTELDAYMKKTFKLQQLELQYQRIQREYEDLVQRQEKREELEQQMGNRMRQENARLRDLNVHLRDQLENTLAQIAHLHTDDAEDAELRHELMRREMMMAQLITQNKELIACKERQEIELEAQRQTLDDQRNHIQILDKALTNAQERNLRLDEECKKKSMYVQRAEQLQRTVKTLQESIQKNEENHKRVRALLEKELAQLQVQKKDTQVKKTSSSRCLQEFDDTLAKLKRDLRDKDDQLSGLQQEVVKWQNMYYEEAKKRQAALDEAVDNKDARIRVLEENSDKAEKMAESARGESKRYLDDLRESNGKVTDLQTKIESLKARLAEKDAMINVLRRRQNAPFGDSSISARSAEATLSEPYNSHETKQRLDAARRRLLQSPSPSRYTTRLYQRHGHKFTSIDASFSLDSSEYGSLGRAGRRSKAGSTVHSGASSLAFNGAAVSAATDITGAADISVGRVQHNRTQSSCEPYLSPFAGSVGAAAALGSYKQREIFTLPTRRSRAKLLTTEQAKSVRPRSADEHLLNRTESQENTDDAKADIASVIKQDGDDLGLAATLQPADQLDVEDNGEELWHV